MKQLAGNPQAKFDVLKSIGYIGDLDDIVREALSNKKSSLWGTLQETLFHLNVKLMSEGFALGTKRGELEWKIRSVVENVENEMLSKAEIPAHLVEPAEFITWLKARIHEHPVNDHELFKFFDKNDLSDEEIRYFLSN